MGGVCAVLFEHLCGAFLCSLLTPLHAMVFFVRAQAPTGSGDTLWWIPLSLEAANAASAGVNAAAAAAAASGGFTTRTWGTQIAYAGPLVDGWLKANLNQTGYYRVSYPPCVWDAIGADLATAGSPTASRLSMADRTMLVDDLFALSYAGVIDTIQCGGSHAAWRGFEWRELTRGARVGAACAERSSSFRSCIWSSRTPFGGPHCRASCLSDMYVCVCA